MIKELINKIKEKVVSKVIVVPKFIETKKTNTTNVEIERKFLMNGFPNDRLFLLEASLVHQAYLSTEPEIRVRSRINEDGSSDCKQAIKGNGTLKRTEIEVGLTEQQFDAILKLIIKNPIEKACRIYMLEDGSRLEVSHVDNEWYYGEVEFNSESEARKWKPTTVFKEYIIKEVTFDNAFKMKNYWKRTRLGAKIDELDILGVLAENEFKAQQESAKEEGISEGNIKYVGSINTDEPFENITEEEIKKLLE